ncbi:acyltransferase family protein [Novosphingobium sp. 9U]|uniref:acyltransferase family protein n=1 Tax=Novosphingobium sp. 9U TaxID=2653158 RepID=UPI0012F3625B|nr:acyltransferase family protein [Novosphingobium sp. 9U]VWX53321.1 Glucans biosynthesis protein C [Novosphingobium sp. 9U]
MVGKTERILYLDSLRAFIMSMGVILHAGMFDRFWFSNFISDASGLFRMKLFVFIAGFFAVMLHDRRGMTALRRERIVRFGLPCLLFILLVNPIANFYMYRYLVAPIGLGEFFSADFTWPSDTPDRINWHQHLWFLIVVLVYCLALPLFLRVAQWRPIVAAAEWVGGAKGSGQGRLLALAVAMTMLLLAGRTLHHVLFYRFLAEGPLNFVVQATLWYSSYFLLGILAFRHRGLFQAMHRAPIWQLLLAATVLTISVLIYPTIRTFGKAPAELVQHIGDGFAGFYISVVMLMIFSRYLNIDSKVIRFLSDASYTVYLFHFSLIAVLGWYIYLLDLGPLMTYVITILVVFIACIAIHYVIVDRGPLPRLIFNGKLPRRAEVNAPR